MLPVTETAFDGANLSIPQVVTLPERSYAAIRITGDMAALPDFAPPRFADLYGWLEERGISGGAGFFRYLAFTADGRVELEVGALLNRPVTGDGLVSTGLLPAGRHIAATYAGPYDRLHDAFCMVSGWLRGRGLTADEVFRDAGRFPAAQIEIYRVTSGETHGPAGLRTDLLLKLAD